MGQKISMNLVYLNAQEAFEDLYYEISENGLDRVDSLAVFNIGFMITNPSCNMIDTEGRDWKLSYAEREFDWYLSGDKSAVEISKHAPIWKRMMDDKGEVNSNYGYQWMRGDQVKYIVDELTKNPLSRRASISIYDAKDRDNFDKDTPCTYAINFMIVDNKINMSVMMRSNDLWYGFCNDQYCFSRLQGIICSYMKMGIGTYYHFTNNMHIYKDKLELL